ncbi:MAG: hypothetical protein IPP97_01720 [Candidatus Obscuribacter sp.]|nr:hypothetical protein [Candidatus Obscuribacter sp.]MBP6350204.1 hypothetical protein [Candidatus Obscuribacter sp.]MBP6592251.1 hypothetical protein [Candidatus Obscuribacter sp.]MBP7575615.1 hypothetical protein [Candidatus Obscuribacter sp.]
MFDQDCLEELLRLCDRYQ